jgi:hypothetical protein
MDKTTELLIHELVNKSLEGTIAQAEIQQLNHLLAGDPQCAAYYVSCVRLHFAFSKTGPLLRERGRRCASDSVLVLQEFAEYEMTAPGVEIPKNGIEDHPEPAAGIEQARAAKISKTPLMTVLVSCAALLMVLIYIYIKPIPMEVATLTDAVDAQSFNADTILSPGTRLLTAQPPVILTRGIVKVLYDNDVEVLIEAPAEYQIQSSDTIRLDHGRLFARVSEAGKGFSVLTRNTKIVDLGTEFGVYADILNKTELHVFKGKTTATATVNNSVQNIGVIGGQAREISADGQARDIHLKKDGFVRAIDSKTNLIWRGQKLDLANLIGGGNGLQEQSTIMLHPTRGITTALDGTFLTSRDYLRLSDNPFVDGVFAPDGRAPQIVSSRGDVFDECPPTSGLFDYQIVVNPEPGLYTTDLRQGTIRFNGQVYGQGQRPCMVMHTNLGITLDLDAVRRCYQGNSLVRFTAQCGIADLDEPYPCNADFWVLVDGKVRYSNRHVREKGMLKEVSVELKETDRFLTLVTTDGGDPDDPASFYTRAISCDWCVFAEPALVLE